MIPSYHVCASGKHVRSGLVGKQEHAHFWQAYCKTPTSIKTVHFCSVLGHLPHDTYIRHTFVGKRRICIVCDRQSISCVCALSRGDSNFHLRRRMGLREGTHSMRTHLPLCKRLIDTFQSPSMSVIRREPRTAVFDVLPAVKLSDSATYSRVRYMRLQL